MSYLYQPARIASSYRPLMFRNSRTTTADAEYLICDVYVNTSLKGTFRKPWTSSAGAYLFDVDVQSIVSRNCAPYTTAKTSIFGTLDNKELTSSTDLLTQYYLYSELEIRNSSGYLETVAGSGETSNTLYALPSIRSMQDVSMDDYYQPSAGGDFLFLTNAPAEQNVGTDENFFISWMVYGTNALNLIFYNAAGSATHNVVVTTASGLTDDRVASVGIGPANIIGTGSLTLASGTWPTSFASIAYYTFSAGTYSGSYTRRSELRRLNVVPRCEWSQRVYWMGPTGGPEQYTFTGQIIRQQTDEGTVGELAPRWDLTSTPPVQGYQRGVVKLDIETQVEIEILEPVDPYTGAWLRGLRSSPEVYLEVDGKYRVITVKPGQTEYERSREGVSEFKAVLIVDRESVQEI